MPVDAAPLVALGALALAILPLLSAGAEKQVLPVTSAEMVDRSVPSTVTYVHLAGLAVPAALVAPGAAALPPYGVLVRDSPTSDATTIVMTDQPPTSGLSRTVVGRVVHRTTGTDPADAFAARGEDTAGLDRRLVVTELAPPDDEPILDVEGGEALQSVEDGLLVRLDVAFEGESLPTCVLAETGCAPRTLAAGDGIHLHLGHATGDGVPVVVQTTFASSLVPGAWTGTQVRNQPELEAFADTVPVQVLAGWGRVLVLVSIADDPTIIRDRLWLGPVMLAALAGLLWAGLRIGYPYFRPGLEGRRRWTSGDDATEAQLPDGGLAVRVSGRVRTLDGHHRHLDDVAARLVRSGPGMGAAGRAPIVLSLADGAEVALAAYDLGTLGSVERGEVVSLHGRRPALWAHWFGADLRLTFETAAERDLAARAVAATGPPLRSSP
jgi:hypothetical protein